MSRPSQSSPVPFGKYLLDEEIACGGMARVYLGRLRGLGGFEKKLVVKQVLPELARDPKFVEMFVEEAKTLVQMSHSNIVPVYELGFVDGVYFLAMEHVEGATLAEILRAGALSPPLVAHLGSHVCEALHYAHTRFELVHRDVTPRNVIVDSSGHCRLLDFGIAAPTEDSGDSGVFGSPGYMSPEQVRLEPVSARSDVFSLGVVLYEALTGTRAFLRKNAEETRRALFNRDRPKLVGLPGIPEELATVLEQTLALDPVDRPPSARALGSKLRGWLASTHPAGVGHELGARAEDARQIREQSRKPRTAESAGRRDPSNIVRTLATSAALDALLRMGENAEGKSSEQVEEAKTILSEGTEGETFTLSERSDSMERTVPLERSFSTTNDQERTRRWAGPRHERGIVSQEPVSSLAPEVPSSARGASRPFARMIGGILLALLASSALLALPSMVKPPARPIQKRVGGTAHRANPSGISLKVGAHPESKETVSPPLESPRAKESGVGRSARSSLETSNGRATATLAINATPWAEAKLDGRRLGLTPKRRVQVSLGEHILEFSCPPLGRVARVPFRAVQGQSVRVLADMTTDPPTIALRTL